MKSLARCTALSSLSLALSIAGAGCAHSGPAAHWTYSGEHGPEHWSAIGSKNAACAGKQQSPIDLTGAAVGEAPLAIDYKAGKATVKNNGHTIVVHLEGAGSIAIGDHKYVLDQFHFHAPSEHAIDGQRAPMELHFVHADAAGKLAVLGVMIRAGQESAALSAIFAALPQAEGEAKPEDAPFDPAALLPAERHLFRYDGSLTIPPCSEGVTWSVLRAPIELSDGQIAAFKALFDNTARPLQPLGDRKLVTDQN